MKDFIKIDTMKMCISHFLLEILSPYLSLKNENNLNLKTPHVKVFFKNIHSVKI